MTANTAVIIIIIIIISLSTHILIPLYILYIL